MRRKIVFISGSRADFGLIQSIVRAAGKDARYEAWLLRVGHSLEEEVDYVHDLEGASIVRVPTPKGVSRLSEGSETALAVAQILESVAKQLEPIRPDMLFVPGDRFEVFACVVAAYYQRIPISHIFGGDRSIGGHLDDSIRHAITKLAHLHFTVCEDSYRRVLRMGEEPDRVFNFGSPVVDNLKDIDFKRPLEGDYAVLTFHPNTSFPDKAGRDIGEILTALRECGIRTYITAPNNEPGSEAIMNVVRRSLEECPGLFTYAGTLGWRDYLNYVKNARFSIGNSSSNLLEAPILGTYSVDVGDRQAGRFAPASVFRCECAAEAVKEQISHVMRLAPAIATHCYGTGHVAAQILDVVHDRLERPGTFQKKIAY